MRINRRGFLATGIAGVAAACSGNASDAIEQASDQAGEPDFEITNAADTAPPPLTPVDAPAFDGTNPFLLGVASGDPDPSSVVLWTRLITEVTTDLEVALDIAVGDNFDELIRSSIVTAQAVDAHSIHAIADGLEPDSWYSYRFRIGEHTSTTGRARTTPTDGMAAVRFGFSSCQNWQQGTYAAHRQLADEDLDFFVWLGDYIYESGSFDLGIATAAGPRVHNSGEITTLDEYRGRYALYKSDPWLQANHAARPWLVTWDDHEVDNDHAGSTSEDGQDLAAFDQRRRMAYKAWWEHQPIRSEPPSLDPSEPYIIYRTHRWGDLLDMHILDGRQFRDPQPTDGAAVDFPAAANLPIQGLGPTSLDPQQSMLGLEQRQWLIDEVGRSEATWSTLANQVYMHGISAFPGDTPTINPDSWDGYAGARRVLLKALSERANNLVVLTGDFHAATVADLRADPFDMSLPILGTEFMAPAISSQFPQGLVGLAPIVLALNTQVQHFDPSNGFMTCSVDETTWTTRIHTVLDPTDEMSQAQVTGMFRVRAGNPGIAESMVDNAEQ